MVTKDDFLDTLKPHEGTLEEACPLCQEPYDRQHVPVVFECGHTFGEYCIANATEGPHPSNHVCPLCRRKLFEQEDFDEENEPLFDGYYSEEAAEVAEDDGDESENEDGSEANLSETETETALEEDEGDAQPDFEDDAQPAPEDEAKESAPEQSQNAGSVALPEEPTPDREPSPDFMRPVNRHSERRGHDSFSDSNENVTPRLPLGQHHLDAVLARRRALLQQAYDLLNIAPDRNRRRPAPYNIAGWPRRSTSRVDRTINPRSMYRPTWTPERSRQRIAEFRRRVDEMNAEREASSQRIAEFRRRIDEMNAGRECEEARQARFLDSGRARMRELMAQSRLRMEAGRRRTGASIVGLPRTPTMPPTPERRARSPHEKGTPNAFHWASPRPESPDSEASPTPEGPRTPTRWARSPEEGGTQ